MTWASETADDIEGAIAGATVEGRAAHEKAYLKSDLDFVGTPVPAVRSAVRSALRASPPPSKDDALRLVHLLWDEPVHEYRMAATFVIDRVDLALDDLPLVERLLREARTWALVDSIAPYCLARLADREPVVDATVAGWGSDPDFWIRRAALLRHLVPLREGRGSLTAFGAVADPLLEDREFFVRKAIGWVLREASKRDPEPVAAWIAPRVGRMSGLTFREATRRLPEPLRLELRAHREG